jgi:hypothetical protein
MGNLPQGQTCLGVKTPDSNLDEAPPWVGTRFGDPSTFQRTDIPGGFHCGWDVWEIRGASILAPLPGVVIESRDRNTVTQAFNMAVHVALRLPEGKSGPNGEREVVMQVLHCQEGSMLPLGAQVDRGDRIARIGDFGPTIGHPHAHIEFFWKREHSHNYDHAKAVDPFWIRRNFLNEPSRLVRVPTEFRWWQDRRVRPTDGRLIRPIGLEVAPASATDVEESRMASAFEAGDEGYLQEPTPACGSGEPLPPDELRNLLESEL